MTFIRIYAKGAYAFVLAVLAAGIAQGLVNGAAAAWVSIIIGVTTTGGVVALRNAPSVRRTRKRRGDQGLTFFECVIILLVIVVFLLAIGWIGPAAR